VRTTSLWNNPLPCIDKRTVSQLMKVWHGFTSYVVLVRYIILLFILWHTFTVDTLYKYTERNENCSKDKTIYVCVWHGIWTRICKWWHVHTTIWFVYLKLRNESALIRTFASYQCWYAVQIHREERKLFSLTSYI
jgi:hypothetical protein